ncbi:hypothetical protein [Streptomyces sp. NPDC051286]
MAVSAASSLTADGSLLSLLTGETTSPITTAAEPIARRLGAAVRGAER